MGSGLQKTHRTLPQINVSSVFGSGWPFKGWAMVIHVCSWSSARRGRTACLGLCSRPAGLSTGGRGFPGAASLAGIGKSIPVSAVLFKDFHLLLFSINIFIVFFKFFLKKKKNSMIFVFIVETWEGEKKNPQKIKTVRKIAVFSGNYSLSHKGIFLSNEVSTNFNPLAVSGLAT